MSRVGLQPIPIPSGVTVQVARAAVTAKGPRGELALNLPDGIAVRVEDGSAVVTRSVETRGARSRHGLARSLVANMIDGVARGFRRDLEINGTGFRAAVQGRTVSLSLGFSGPKEFTIPEGITVTVENGTQVSVTGADKQCVGDVAARIRSYYPVEPYKGKGIQYKGEKVKRKVGKTVA
jgi:large subunit ribosomal protein L6